jgi:hypothetical protein
MIQTSSEFDVRNAVLGKKPIYVFAIGGQDRVYTTHDLTAEGVTGTVPEYRAWLKTPQGATQSIDVLNGQSSIGELELEVIEQNGEMRTLVGGTTLEGKRAVLSIGYPGMAYENFVVLHTYQLYKIMPSKTYTSWLFCARDQQLVEKRTIYTHPANGNVIDGSNPWILQGTPAEIMQAVYLWGLDRSAAELDRTTLLQLDSGAEGFYKAVRPFFFQMTEAFEAKQFLETEIYKCAGLYPVVDNLGRLSVRGFRPPVAGPASVFTFSQDNMVVLPEIDRMSLVNELVFQIDYTDGDFQNELVFVEGTSISTYGRSGQNVIESKGLRTELGAQWFCEEVATRIFRRFAGTPEGLRGGAPVYSIEAFLLTLPVWAGDYVYVSHSLMPDILTGSLGVTNRIMEVIDREPDFANGRMKYKLLDTGLTGLQPAHKWAASNRDFIIGTSEIY